MCVCVCVCVCGDKNHVFCVAEKRARSLGMAWFILCPCDGSARWQQWCSVDGNEGDSDAARMAQAETLIGSTRLRVAYGVCIDSGGVRGAERNIALLIDDEDTHRACKSRVSFVGGSEHVRGTSMLVAMDASGALVHLTEHDADVWAYVTGARGVSCN